MDDGLAISAVEGSQQISAGGQVLSLRRLRNAVGQTVPLFATIGGYPAVLIDNHSCDINRVAGCPASDQVAWRLLITVVAQAPSSDTLRPKIGHIVEKILKFDIKSVLRVRGSLKKLPEGKIFAIDIVSQNRLNKIRNHVF